MVIACCYCDESQEDSRTEETYCPHEDVSEWGSAELIARVRESCAKAKELKNAHEARMRSSEQQRQVCQLCGAMRGSQACGWAASCEMSTKDQVRERFA